LATYFPRRAVIIRAVRHMPSKRSNVMGRYEVAGSQSAASGGATHSVPADTIRYPKELSS